MDDLQYKFRHALQSWFDEFQISGDLGQIAGQLIVSISSRVQLNQNNFDWMLEKKKDELNDFIRDILYCFKYDKRFNELGEEIEIPYGGEGLEIFHLSPEEFCSAISKMPDKLQSKFKSLYGVIWLGSQFAFPSDVDDEDKYYNNLKNKYIGVREDGISDLARIYVKKEDFVSSTLEWAMINSLLYVTAGTFFGRCHSEIDEIGSNQWNEYPLIQNYISAPNLFAILKLLLKWHKRQKLKFFGDVLLFGGVGVSVVAVILLYVVLSVFTFAISYFIAGKLIDYFNMPINVWIVAVFLWLFYEGWTMRHGIISDAVDKKNRAKYSEIFWSLKQLVSKTSTDSFNTNEIKYLLLKVEERSMMLNTALFDILEKRVNRNRFVE